MVTRNTQRTKLNNHPRTDRYVATLIEGNRRDPIYYDAVAFLNTALCEFLEQRIDYQAKIIPIHTGGRDFKYIRRNGRKVLSLNYSEAIWLLKHIVYGAPLTTSIAGE